MIGYTNPKNNDITLYFEDNEIEILSTKKIQGAHVSIQQQKIVGILEIIIDDALCRKNAELISTDMEKNEEGHITQLFLSIRQYVYESFKEKGMYSLHQGFRHINLLDTNRLNAFWEMEYELLKEYRPK